MSFINYVIVQKQQNHLHLKSHSRCDASRFPPSTMNKLPGLMRRGHGESWSYRVLPTERCSPRNWIELYLESPLVKLSCNPYDWWTINRGILPHIAGIARNYLCIPATSVASERLFSKCGLLISDRRASLKANNVEKIVFLSQNMWFCASDYNCYKSALCSAHCAQ